MHTAWILEIDRCTITMEESISSSRTTAFYDGNSYFCNYNYQQQQQPPPAAAAAAAPAAVSDYEDAADSSWTAYFLQLASDEEEEDASASNRDVCAVDVPACGKGSRSGSASMVSKPNKANDNKQEAVKKGVKKTRIVDEEDPLQDTASSPLVQLNTTGDLKEVWSTPARGRDRPPVQRSRRSGGDINGSKD